MKKKKEEKNQPLKHRNVRRCLLKFSTTIIVQVIKTVCAGVCVRVLDECVWESVRIREFLKTEWYEGAIEASNKIPRVSNAQT